MFNTNKKKSFNPLLQNEGIRESRKSFPTKHSLSRPPRKTLNTHPLIRYVKGTTAEIEPTVRVRPSKSLLLKKEKEVKDAVEKAVIEEKVKEIIAPKSMYTEVLDFYNKNKKAVHIAGVVLLTVVFFGTKLNGFLQKKTTKKRSR